jgi:diacylglycerol kinase family enzyme
MWQWTRASLRIITRHPNRSPFVRITSGRRFKVRFPRAVPYELDGGARKPTRRLRIKVEPAAIHVCVPRSSA